MLGMNLPCSAHYKTQHSFCACFGHVGYYALKVTSMMGFKRVEQRSLLSLSAGHCVLRVGWRMPSIDLY